MPGISEWMDFDFYDCVWWLDKKNHSTTDHDIILRIWIGTSHKIGSNMCYWLLTLSGKTVDRTTVQYVIHTDLINTDMKWRIEKFEEELEKWLDDTTFVDDVGVDFYIDDVHESDYAAHEYGSNTPSDEVYGDIMTEEHPDQENIGDAA